MSAAIFELRTERYDGGQLAVVSFQGIEGISRPFSFEILCSGTGVDAASLEADVVGRSATFELCGEGDARRSIHGVVRRVRAEGVGGDAEGRHRYRLWLAPRLWALGQNRNSRIFQDRTVREIVDQIFAESRIPCRHDLVGSSSPRPYCVQYQESDLRFVERILAEEGLVYFFDHQGDADGGDVVVLADDTRLCAPIAGAPELVFRDSSGMVERGEEVRRFQLEDRVRPRSVLLREFDFRRPSLDLVGEAATPGTHDELVPPPRALDRGDAPLLRMYDHHTELGEEHADAGALAARHLEQHRARAEVGTGRSRCRRLEPGRWFELTGAALHEHDGRYLVVRVRHEGRHPERGGTADPALEVYANRFECVRADVAHRPPRPRRRLQQVLETAIVVGPAGQEIYTDAHARIKVQFHWDRQGRRDERSSCWLRVMQAWAGAGWGFQFIPRVGMEVLVMFAGGDTDRPIVIGCAYNAAHPPPFPLPAEKTKSGIRTDSTRGGGGHNELSFEDRRGWEQVYVRAEKDLQAQVKNDLYGAVEGSSTYRVGKNHVVQVGERSLTNVGGNAVTVVDGDSHSAIGGNLNESVNGAASRRVAGECSQTATGRGSERWESSLDRWVGADLTCTVDGARHERVGGASDASVGGRAAFHAHENLEVDVAGEIGMAVGKGLRVMFGASEAPTSMTVSDAGATEIAAAESVSLSAGDRVVMRTDEASLRLSGDTLTLVATKIRLQADTIEIVGSSSSLRLGDDLEGAGKTVKLTSDDDAKLELATDAKLAGAKVKLGSAASASKLSASSDSADQERRETTVHLYDRSGRKLRNAPYEISYPGYFARGTSADGTVRVRAPAGVDTVRARWGRAAADREEGSRAPELEFRTEIYLAVDSPDPDEALRRKLHNLGHRAKDLAGAAREHMLATGNEVTDDVDDVRGDVDDMHGAARAPSTGGS